MSTLAHSPEPYVKHLQSLREDLAITKIKIYNLNMNLSNQWNLLTGGRTEGNEKF